MSGSRGRSRRDAGGWVLFDVLIGAVILTAGLLGTTLAFNQSQQSNSRAARHAEAVALASSLLSQATAYGCGAETGLSLPGSPPSDGITGYPYTGNLWNQCAAIYAGNADAPFSGALGDPVTASSPRSSAGAWQVSWGGTEFAVSYRAAWVATGTSGGCPQASTGRTPLAPTPIGQTREVTITWVDEGVPVTFSNTAFAGVPVDATVYSSPDAGGIVVTGMAPGSMARLAVPSSLLEPGISGIVLVDRAASTAGCAWFPFLLPAGPDTYSVRYYANGDASGPVSATSPSTLSVRTSQLVRWTA